MLNIINFVDIASNAIIGAFNVDEIKTIPHDSAHEIIIDKNSYKVFSFYIKNFIKAEYQYGMQNIVLNTCRPSNNWRNSERGASIKACKYDVCDNSIIIDNVKLEKQLNKIFNSLKRELKTFIFIEFSNIDIIDSINFINYIMSTNRVSSPRPSYNLLADANIEYNHYVFNDKNINHDLLHEVKEVLTKNKLI